MRKIILLCLIFQIASCQNRDKQDLDIRVPKDIYTSDSISLIKLIKIQIAKHNVPYQANFYDTVTPVIIDTIVYSPKFNKIVFFVIDSVENKRAYPDKLTAQEIEQLERIGNLPYEGYHYNGTAFVGKRIDKSFEIFDFSRWHVGKFRNFQDIRAKMRQKFFTDYASKEVGAEYNVGDSRFWDNPKLWNLMEKEKAKRDSFIKTKRENPRNVYEP